jgi:hypothetical protein
MFNLFFFTLIYHQVNYWQNPGCIQYGEKDEPGKVIIAGCLPHRNQFPNDIPDHYKNDHRQEPDEPFG